jgi:hypothetical protein
MGLRIGRMHYYLVRGIDPITEILAIHKVLDSAEAIFQKIVSRPAFRGSLEIVMILTDELGLTISERTIYRYSSVEGVLISYKMIDGIMHIQHPPKPQLSIRVTKKMTAIDTTESLNRNVSLFRKVSSFHSVSILQIRSRI